MDPFDRPQVIAHSSAKEYANASPGPAAYNTTESIEKGVVPIIMKSRHSEHSETSQVGYYKVPSTLGKVPKISIHGKPQTHGGFVTPGPSFIPPQFGKGAKGSTFAQPSLPTKTRGDETGQAKARPHHDADISPGPGPAFYDTRDKTFSKLESRGFSIKGNHDFKYSKSDAPGPGTYVPKYDSALPKAPKYTLHARPKDPEAKVTAPPYRVLKSTMSGPMYTMKARASDEIHVM